MRVLSDANASYQVLGLPIASDVLGLEGLEAQHYRIDGVALEFSELAIIPFPRLAQLDCRPGALQQLLDRLLRRQLVR